MSYQYKNSIKEFYQRKRKGKGKDKDKEER